MTYGRKALAATAPRNAPHRWDGCPGCSNHPRDRRILLLGWQRERLSRRGQSAFGSQSFLRALQASGAVTIRPNTPTTGAITIDYNNDARNGKFTGNDIFFEVIPGVWIEILEPDHAAFDHCTNFTFAG